MDGDPEAATILGGRYERIRLVGKGGMGEVYEGLDLQTRRRVAIKQLRVERGAPADLATRFARELRATAQITSRHVVALHDGGVDDATGEPYLVMDFLVGEDLGALADRLGTLPVDLALRLTAQACDGVAAAHAAGIIHRDIKPTNLFLVAPTAGASRLLKILDFGIARIGLADRDADALTELTRTGTILGSPLYMAPEQLRGIKTLDHRADVWSLGVVLYRLLCGSVPHTGATLADLLITVCSTPAPPLRGRAPWISPELEEVVHRALEIDPERRIPTARAFADALRRWLPDGNAITDAMVVPMPALALAQTATAEVAGDDSAVAASRSGAGPAIARSAVRAVPTPVRVLVPAPVPAAPVRVPPTVRAGYVIVLLAVVVIAVVAALRARSTSQADDIAPGREPELIPDVGPELAHTPGARWFEGIRTRCTALEVREVLPTAPASLDGTAFAAACAALAGDLATARGKIEALEPTARPLASSPMFLLAHQMADRGNRAPIVGAIMTIVLDAWPDNYQALYDAGVVEFEAGDPHARPHLQAFVARYPSNDAFRQNALRMLDKLAGGTPPPPHR